MKHYKANRRTARITMVTFPERKAAFEKFALENGYESLTDLAEQSMLSLMLAKSVKTGVPISTTRRPPVVKSIKVK